MSKKAVRWLYEQLPKLVEQRVLTPEDAGRLRNYYGEVKGINRTVLIIGCSILGALLIGLGIILLFGHNWENLPKIIRVALCFLMLLAGQGVAAYALIKRPVSLAFNEAAATFQSLMVGACLALISQTYNFSTDMGWFCLTWALLIAPLVYVFNASIPASLYLMGITCWSVMHHGHNEWAVAFWPMAAFLVPHFLKVIKSEMYTFRAAILSFTAVVCLSFALHPILDETWPHTWIFLYPCLFGIYYAIGEGKFQTASTNWQRPLTVFGMLGILISSFILTYHWIWDHRFEALAHELTVTSIGEYAISLVIVALAMLLFLDAARRRHLEIARYLVMPMLAIICYVSSFGSAEFPVLVFNTYLLVIGIDHIRVGVRSDLLGQTNLGMLILGALLTLRFFDSQIDFVIKGILFVALGTGFLVTNLMLLKKKGGNR